MRLYVDRPEDLNWMAPHWAKPNGIAPTYSGVSVHPWPNDDAPGPPGPLPQVVIEAFGCDLPPLYITQLAHQAHTTPSSSVVWINLDYMSAEAFYQNIHRMPSPQLWGPAKGLTKWFYQPGFTPKSGGLLRPHPVPREREDLGGVALVEVCVDACIVPSPGAFKPDTVNSEPLQWVLFCYEPVALKDLLLQLSVSSTPVLLQVAPGRATHHTLECIELLWPKSVQERTATGAPLEDPNHTRMQLGNLSLSFLPYMDQFEFDQLLLQSSLNFVRGEDSLVQAIWAQKPFIWQIYPQDDGAHGPKLEAFLETLQAPQSLEIFMRVWNGLSSEPLPELGASVLEEWRVWSQEYAKRMQNVPDLAKELVLFSQELKAHPPNPD